MKAELEKKDVEYEENLAKGQAKYLSDRKNLENYLHESEAKREELKEELRNVQDRLIAQKTKEFQELMDQLMAEADHQKSNLHDEIEALKQENVSVRIASYILFYNDLDRWLVF